MKKKLLFITIIGILSSCSYNKTTQVAENIFVHNSQVYKIIDNELTLLASLDDDSIRQFQVFKPEKRSFENKSLSYIKRSAYAKLDALYRGNFLYFNLYILGFEDLKDNYSTGYFTLYFTDEYGFEIHSTEISTSELTGMVGDNNEDIVAFSYSGKTEMSNDIYKALQTYGLSSTVSKRR